MAVPKSSRGKEGKENRVTISRKPYTVKRLKRGVSKGVRITLKGAEKERRVIMGMVPRKAKKETQKNIKTKPFLGASLRDRIM